MRKPIKRSPQSNAKLDWGTEFPQSEYDNLVKQYGAFGGSEVMNRFRFVPFMYQLRPDALKRYRLWVNAVTGGVGLDDSLPNPPYVSIVMACFYITLPYAQGIIAEIACARKFGARKQEIADLLALGWIHSGPYGVNTIAEVAGPYMEAWEENDGAPGVTWPEGWSVEPDVFRCGIDFSQGSDENHISPAELAKIKAWHRKWEGEVPKYVPFLAKHYPLALRALRARYENALMGSLPKQLIALCRVVLSAAWMRPDALRRSVYLAKQVGVSKDHVVQILVLAQLYIGDVGMDGAIDGMGTVLDRWNNK